MTNRQTERLQQRNENARRVYRFIQAHNADHPYPPSIIEISRGCYVARATVIRYLDLLEAWGSISRDPGVARSIAITGALPAHLFPEGEDEG